MTGRGWAGLKRFFRLPLTRSRVDAVLDDELHFHIEERSRELQALGMSREQADGEARRRFGDYDAYKREARSLDEMTIKQRSRLELVDTVRRETRHAVATLIRSPSFSAIAVVTLALGLGAATTIFTLLDRVVLRPLPYPNAERMVHIGTLWPFVRADAEFAISVGQFFYFKQNSKTLANLGLYDATILPVPGDGGAHPAERVPVIVASSSLFGVLGIRAERGALSRPGMARDTSIALISHGYWERRFGADPKILGKTIVFGRGTSLQIIGVLPAGANVPDFKADIWCPNWYDPFAQPQNNHTHHAIGLAKAGVTLEEVASDLKHVEKQFESLWPKIYDKGFINAGFALRVNWLQRQIVGDKVTRALWILFGAVAVLLLIAVANVANLFLVRIDARRREVAVRTALGAGRGQLAIHFLTESMLLTLVAAIGAVFMSYALLHVVLTLAPKDLPRLEEVSLSWRSVAFGGALALVIGLIFGAAPLVSAVEDVALLREGGRGLTTSHGRNAARRMLVVSQVGLAVVLFSAAALMVKSYARLREVRPGFDPNGVIVMGVILPYTHYQTWQQTSAFWRQFLERVRAIPGVISAGATETLPLGDQSGCSGVVTDVVQNGGRRGGCVPTIPVSPGYFETMGIPVRGSTPDWATTDAGIGPVVVSKAFADEKFPGEDPIGHGIKINNEQFPYFRIVGVAGDVRANGLQKPPVNAVYFPLVPAKGSPGWDAGHYMVLALHAPTLDAAHAFAAVRRVAGEVDPEVPVDDPTPMEVIVAKSMAQTSFTMMLLLISASIALLLSAVGLYGVVSYLVSHRRGEIGIRMALGARIGQVTQMVMSQSLVLALLGVAVGVGFALLGTRLLQSLLFEVSPTDPLVLLLTSFALLVVAALASLAPARRAARVDPVEALRNS